MWISRTDELKAIHCVFVIYLKNVISLRIHFKYDIFVAKICNYCIFVEKNCKYGILAASCARLS